ncbi:hypothetical protein CEXT_493911, partial [Caerostris extrusa]
MIETIAFNISVENSSPRVQRRDCRWVHPDDFIPPAWLRGVDPPVENIFFGP